MGGRGRGGRGGGRGGRGGFGSAKLGANSIALPEGMTIDYSKQEVLLYPLHDVKSYKPANSEELDIHHINVTLQKRIRDSMYYSEPPKPKPEVELYFHKYLREAAKPSFRSEIAKISINLDYFPDELHSVVTGKKRRVAVKNNDDFDLSKLAQLEKEELILDGKSPPHVATKTTGEGESDEEQPLEEEELESDLDEDENDYAVDHYDDDMDALGSDQGGDDY